MHIVTSLSSLPVHLVELASNLVSTIPLQSEYDMDHC
jgi:hypothetical protein